jgi:uncharacterized membrane protein YidH (DUF202 family)
MPHLTPRPHPQGSGEELCSARRKVPLKAATLVGVLLIIIGVAGFAFAGFHYTQRHRDADVGPLHISHRQHKTIPVPPILSGIALVGGIVLVVTGAKSS